MGRAVESQPKPKEDVMEQGVAVEVNKSATYVYCGVTIQKSGDTEMFTCKPRDKVKKSFKTMEEARDYIDGRNSKKTVPLRGV